MSKPTKRQALKLFVDAKLIDNPSPNKQKGKDSLLSIREYLIKSQKEEMLPFTPEFVSSILDKFTMKYGMIYCQEIVKNYDLQITTESKILVTPHFLNKIIKFCEYNVVHRNPHTAVGLGIGIVASTFLATLLACNFVIAFGGIPSSTIMSAMIATLPGLAPLALLGGPAGLFGLLAFSAIIAAVALGVYSVGLIIAAGVTGETLPRLESDNRDNELPQKPIFSNEQDPLLPRDFKNRRIFDQKQCSAQDNPTTIPTVQ